MSFFPTTFQSINCSIYLFNLFCLNFWQLLGWFWHRRVDRDEKRLHIFSSYLETTVRRCLQFIYDNSFLSSSILVTIECSGYRARDLGRSVKNWKLSWGAIQLKKRMWGRLFYCGKRYCKQLGEVEITLKKHNQIQTWLDWLRQLQKKKKKNTPNRISRCFSN